MKVLAPQSCQTLWDPKDYSPPDSSVHGVLYRRILEWLPLPSSIIKIWSQYEPWLLAFLSFFFFSFCNATSWLKFDWLIGSTSKRHPFQRWKSWLNTLPATGRWKASSPISLCSRDFWMISVTDTLGCFFACLFVCFIFSFPSTLTSCSYVLNSSIKRELEKLSASALDHNESWTAR